LITHYSRSLTRAELDRFVAAARATPHFRPARGGGIFSLTRPRIPALPGYRFSPYMDIMATHEEAFEPSFFDRFFALMDECRSWAVSTAASLRVAQSDRPRPPEYEEGEDQSRVTFGVGEYGSRISYAPAATLDIGGMGEWARSYNGVFWTLGLGDDLEATVCDGRLRLEVKSDRVFRPPHGEPLQDYRDRAGGRLVSVNASYPDGTDFGEVTLDVFSPHELRGEVDALVSYLGPDRFTGPARVGVAFRPDRIEEIRRAINGSGFTPWELQLSVESGYTLDDLDRAIAEHDSFLIRAFTLRVPKAGEMEVLIHYGPSGFSLDFSHSDTTPAKSEKLRSVILELAGDSDFLTEPQP
jgi:hypothetical protein